MTTRIRIGLIGAGGNTRLRHIPGFLAVEDLELLAVCNRRPESSAAIAREYNIARTYERWQDVIADPDVNAIVIGTWPYLHCPITLAALEAGKHVLTEARLSMNAAEAHRMLQAAKEHAGVVAQIVPSPFGLNGTEVVRELLADGFIGDLREVQLFSMNAALADPAAPLSWRQDLALSGFNMLTLGILHETLLRWVPPPVRVLAQIHAHIPARIDPESGVRRSVGTPDSVQALAILTDGSRATYHFSGVTPYGQSMGVHLLGTRGAICYDLLNDRITGAGKSRGDAPGKATELREIPIPPEKARPWRVEADFVDAIRLGTPVRFTDFATGVAYMEFTEAVARSAEKGEPIELPLEDVE